MGDIIDIYGCEAAMTLLKLCVGNGLTLSDLKNIVAECNKKPVKDEYKAFCQVYNGSGDDFKDLVDDLIAKLEQQNLTLDAASGYKKFKAVDYALDIKIVKKPVKPPLVKKANKPKPKKK